MAPLLASARGSVVQFILTSLPFFIVLVFFLYSASRRPYLAIYNTITDDDVVWQQAIQDSGTPIRLMDMLTIYLSFLGCWVLFAVYIIVFVPKRRHLVGRYLSEGRTVVGDVIYDETMSMATSGWCGKLVCGSCCCCVGGKFYDYGYAIYTHPNDVDVVQSTRGQQDQDGQGPGQAQQDPAATTTIIQPPFNKRIIRKRVRVYQRYTREQIAILVLPTRPLSGQAKVDLEIDLLSTRKERDHVNGPIAVVAIVWIVFLLVAPLYLLYIMDIIDDSKDGDPIVAKRLYLVVVGLVLPVAWLMNYIRFIFYKNWLINRGAITSDVEEARLGHGCLMTKPSQDENGTNHSIMMAYSMMNDEATGGGGAGGGVGSGGGAGGGGDEEESYKGELPEHPHYT